MPIHILELGKQFRPSTSIIYPPFKNGKYMEEYFYDYVIKHNTEIDTDRVYIPVFWTNIQNHPNFQRMKDNYNILLNRAYNVMPEDTKYFTIVQNDLGVELTLPKDTLVFGACHGDIPLPLIYEDKQNRLLNTPRNINKQYLASFVGTYTTHQVRNILFNTFEKNPEFKFESKKEWTNCVPEKLATNFIETTLSSRFCLAPRGFGRSSFRFFEAMLLDTIPVYVWDDIEWLPYKDVLDYTKFSVSINSKNINNMVEILKSISNEKYLNMIEELKSVRHYFSLEGMSEYIFNKIKLIKLN
jgi:hypothetical protein